VTVVDLTEDELAGSENPVSVTKTKEMLEVCCKSSKQKYSLPIKEFKNEDDIVSTDECLA
jgi:hypothetical protein